MITQATTEVLSRDVAGRPVAVIVPLYNYAGFILETLESVIAQSWRDLAVIVVDDCSTDHSVAVVQEWMLANRDCAIGMGLWRNDANARLATTRNTGVSLATSDYCFFLDADNVLYPRCIEKHLAALEQRPDAAAAFGLIEIFGSRSGLMGARAFDREALSHGNYIDAMAMVRRKTLLDLGGFHHIDHGWEDYDFWLRLCEAGGKALHVPEIVARYREHGASMLRTETNLPDHIKKLHAEMVRRHTWLDLH